MITTVATRPRVHMARDVMQRDPITVSPRISTLDLVRMMNRYDIHGAPVVDDRRRIHGVVSRADVLGLMRWELGLDMGGPDPFAKGEVPDEFFRFVPTEGSIAWPEDPRLAGFSVEEIMSAAAFAVSPWTSVRVIDRRFDSSGLHRILVVEGDKLEGLVTPQLLRQSAWRT